MMGINEQKNPEKIKNESCPDISKIRRRLNLSSRATLEDIEPFVPNIKVISQIKEKLHKLKHRPYTIPQPKNPSIHSNNPQAPSNPPKTLSPATPPSTTPQTFLYPKSLNTVSPNSYSIHFDCIKGCQSYVKQNKLIRKSLSRELGNPNSSVAASWKSTNRENQSRSVEKQCKNAGKNHKKSPKIANVLKADTRYLDSMEKVPLQKKPVEEIFMLKKPNIPTEVHPKLHIGPGSSSGRGRLRLSLEYQKMMREKLLENITKATIRVHD